MAEVTVEQLAKVVGTPVDKLLEQLTDAGLKFTAADQVISDNEKLQLLEHLRDSRSAKLGNAEGDNKKITLRRKSTSQLKVSGGQGRTSTSSTVNVEVRRKKTYVKRSDLVEEQEQKKREEEEALEAIRLAEEAEQKKRDDEANTAAEKLRLEEEAVKEAADKVAQAEAEKAAQALAAAKATAAPAPAPTVEKKPAATKDKKPARKRDGKRAELHVSSDKRGRRKPSGGRNRGRATVESSGKHAFERPTEPVIHEVEVPESISVADLSQKMAIKAAEVIKVMMKMGAMATINQVIDQDTAILVVEEMGHVATPVQTDNVESDVVKPEYDDAARVTRPPVVTVMGHVDHGKTSLLDYIRRAKVADGEAGGITQHVGAYHVETDNGVITFLDTPGHAAFTAMRARGAQVTDIVVLVVSADDGVMPQTKEAVDHAKAAGVPLVIAVNKIDKEGVDPDRVRTDLSGLEVVPEEWGGDTIFINVSAKTGEGVEQLLDAISLQAEVLELKAVPEGPATGTIIESTLDRGRGPVCTVLVQEGRLARGDLLLAGEEYGRVRAIFDEQGNQIESAGPSLPVVVLGLSGTVQSGEDAIVAESERKAREIAEGRRSRTREIKLAAQQAAKLENIFTQMKESEMESVNILVKADVQGSAEALRESLLNLSTDEVKVTIVSAAVGGITESDINLAAASSAIVMGFNVRADGSARKALDATGVDLRYYSVIYEAIDDVKSAMSGLLSPELREEIIGVAEVKDVFKSSALGAVAGCQVVEGLIKRGSPIRVLRNNVVIYEGELESLRRHKDDVNEVRSGTECGIAVKNYNDVRPGDNIEVYTRTEIARTID
ncbi:MAG: translation initiation factor IF-2 [Proteobacteria bacterium]|jgi:translation initiation factor IF-2|nr:translation initiation factor IF-2 [Pseudomonadota bacterium]